MSIEASHDTQSFYLEVWGWLIGLLILGTLVVFLPIPRVLALIAVFGIALVKAILVVRNYMHLKAEHLIIYLIAAIPVLLIVAMLFALMPDIAFHH